MRAIYLVLAVLMVSIIFGGGWWYHNSLQNYPPYDGLVESLTLAAYEGEVAVLAYLARENGYFASQGLDVTITNHSSGRASLDEVEAREADVSTSGSAAVVADSFARSDLRILGTSARLDLNQVVARRDRGISMPSDLAGKRVAILKDSTPEFLFGRYLVYSGVTIDDVELVYLSPQEIVVAVLDGTVDAGVIWDPLAYRLKQQLGESAVSWSIQPNERDSFLIVSTREWIEANPSVAERFTRAMVQAEDFAKRNPQATREFIASMFELEKDYVNDVWEKITLTIALPQSLLLQMEEQASWRLENGLSEGPMPNYLDFMYVDALKAVKPWGVTVIGL